jgi:hypothetical protein
MSVVAKSPKPVGSENRPMERAVLGDGRFPSGMAGSVCRKADWPVDKSAAPSFGRRDVDPGWARDNPAGKPQDRSPGKDTVGAHLSGFSVAR